MKVEEEMASGGFKMMDFSSLNRVPASWSAPLPASSITNLQGDGEAANAVNLVAAAAQKQAESAEASPKKQLSAKGGETTSSDKDMKEESPAKKEDLDLKRLKQSRSSDATVRDHLKKLQEALRKGWQAYEMSDAGDDDLRKLLTERAQIIMHCIAMEPQAGSEGSVPADQAANGGSGSGGAGAESGASGVSGAAAAAIVLKPIEYDMQDR